MDSFKILEILGEFLNFGGNSWKFWGFFGELFGNFWKIPWWFFEEFFGKSFEHERNVCQYFVSMEEDNNLDLALEVREASSSHLKMKVYKTNWKTIKFGIKKFNLFIQACLSHSCTIVITDIASITDGVICNFTYQFFGRWIPSTIKKGFIIICLK